MIEHVKKNFKGQAMDENGDCFYLMEDGRKCAVGLFIPDGHESQAYKGTSLELLLKYKDLIDIMPLEKIGLNMFQRMHDSMNFNDVEEETRELINWIEKNVA